MLRRILIIVLVVVVILVAIFAIRYYLMNNDVGDPGVAEDGTTEVVEEGRVATIDISEEESGSEDVNAEAGTAAVEEESYPAAESAEEVAAAEGEAAVAEEEVVVAEGEAVVAEEESAPAEGEAVIVEGETTSAERESDANREEIVQEGVAVIQEGVTAAAEAIGGLIDSGDTNVGGGVPTEEEAAAPVIEAAPAESETAPAESETAPAENETASTESEVAMAESSTDAAAPAEGSGTGGMEELAALSPVAQFVSPGVATDHYVADLEWLTQVARCYGTTVADIQAANNYTCPDLIYPGTTIHIANPGNAGPITINEAPCFMYHTVQQGETLYSIANQYGINYQWLARINAVYNYNYIQVGQTLVIPNPVDQVFTQPPAQPFYYSNCWYNYCPGWQYPPVAVPYGY